MFNPLVLKYFEKLETPFYFYDTGLLQKTLFAIKEAASLYQYSIHYAIKANSNERILRIISSYGLGADCVSGNEIERALSCGFTPNKIVFAGVGKTDQEIKYSIDENISCINCESIEELQVINSIAQDCKKKVRVALRINPNIDANTHHHVTTGLSTNKFGISQYELMLIIKNINNFKNLQINGLHFHIGSQITDLNVFKELIKAANTLQNFLREQDIQIHYINLGGGLGIDYENPENQIPDFQAYFSEFNKSLQLSNGQTVHFEPGRSIVGQCGSLISRVLFVKNNGDQKTIILDSGFTELLRPALYQSNHKIVNLSSLEPLELYDIAGPICETSDYFGRSILLPSTQRGDLIAILSVGAYGEVMASQYNLRTIASKYFSEDIKPELEKSEAIFHNHY